MLTNGSTTIEGLAGSVGTANGSRATARPFADAEHPHRLGNVLERALAQIVVGEVELARDLGMHLGGNADAAGLGQLLQPHRQVDAVAVEIAVFDDHFAEVDADAQLQRQTRGVAGIALGHPLLQLDGAFDRTDGARELDEDAIAHQLENAAAVPGDQRLQHILPARPQRFQRARLVFRHEAAVPHDIGGEYGGKLALHEAGDPGGWGSR